MKRNKAIAMVVICLLMSSMMAFWAPKVSTTPQHRMVLPFKTGWENTQPIGRTDSRYDWNDFSGYPAPHNPPPELGRRPVGDMGVTVPPDGDFLHYTFGSYYLMAAGNFDSSNSYCTFNLFDSSTESDYAPGIRVRPHMFISVFYYHYDLSHCMIDAELYNERTGYYSSLSNFVYTKRIDGMTITKYIVDQNGTRIHPGYRYNDPTDSWQFASFDLSIIHEKDPDWCISRIWVGFDNRKDPVHPTGPARTYFDWLSISYGVGAETTTTMDGGGAYYNAHTCAVVEPWDYKYLEDGYSLWLKVAVSGFNNGYEKDPYTGEPLSSIYPYRLRVVDADGGQVLTSPPPTGLNLSEQDSDWAPDKSAAFVMDVVWIMMGLLADWYIVIPMAAVDLAKAFWGLIAPEEPAPTYEWPIAQGWYGYIIEDIPRSIFGEVYVIISGLTPDVTHNLSITLEVDHGIPYVWEGVYHPGHCGTESIAIDFTWTNKWDDVNLPPDPPSAPSGPSSGYKRVARTYSTSTADLNGDDVQYKFYWGDGSTTTTDWHASGETAYASHFWSSSGTYDVRVRARDSEHDWGSWSPKLTVTIIDHPPKPPPAQEHQYTVMEGVTTTCGEILYDPILSDPWYWDQPFHTRPPNLTPLLMNRNITFSDPDPETGVVYLTVPAETYDGLNHIFFDAPYGTYFRYQLFTEGEGYGWLFTGEGTNPISGDVDYYTFSDNTGTYWGPESPKAGQLAALTGGFPDFGPDGIAGTGDDGFGDGTPDPSGFSILYLPTTLDVDLWDGVEWVDFYEAPWPQVWTTAVAYNIVDADSAIDGVSSTVVGKPWEFLAGEDHPEYDPVPWSQPYSNAYVSYVCTWSVLDVSSGSLDVDIHFKIEERLVRQDCVIADINGDEQVDIVDQVIAALAFEAEDEGPGLDGIIGTADDMPIADPNFDARGDVSDRRGEIDIVDIVRIAINYGWKLTPDGIQK